MSLQNKKMKIKILSLAISAFIFTQCSSQKNNANTQMPTTNSEAVNSTYPTSKPEEGVIRLTEKQNLFLDKEKVNITFKKVTEDNRCPMNARCITAGHASLEIEVMGRQTRPIKFIISTIEDPQKNLKNSFVFNHHKYTLVNFYPATSTEMGFEELKGKYMVDIKVE